MPSSIRIPLNREGVLRVHVVPRTALTARIAGEQLQLPLLRLDIAGTCEGLPDGTPVQVVATVHGRPDGPGAETTATLKVPGYRPGAATPVACSLHADIDLFACRAIGAAVDLDIELRPSFPRAPTAVLATRVDLACKLAIDGLAGACIGSPVTLTPVVDARLRDAQLRVTMQEVDAVAGADADAPISDGGVAERVVPDGQPSTDIRWPSAAEPEPARVWHVGCASTSTQLEYLQSEEVGGFEFGFELEASFDGETFGPVAFAAPIVHVARPRLVALDLARTKDGELEVRVDVAGIAAGFEIPVIVELWRAGATRPALVQPLVLVGGALQATLGPPKPLGLRRGEQVHATLALAPTATLRTNRAASQWLAYDPETFVPKPKDAAKAERVRSKPLKL